MRAYYNDNCTHVCEWTHNLIRAGLVSDGVVDDRSMHDVRAEDLVGFTRWHFFSGVCGWEYALQLSGWPCNRPVASASLPCQPWSVAGKQKGEADERHLWPAFHRLLESWLPDTIFGEQVAGREGRRWMRNVAIDLERLGYTVAVAVLPAAAAGAPHQRHRFFWAASRREEVPSLPAGEALPGILSECAVAGRMPFDLSGVYVGPESALLARSTGQVESSTEEDGLAGCISGVHADLDRERLGGRPGDSDTPGAVAEGTGDGLAVTWMPQGWTTGESPGSNGSPSQQSSDEPGRCSANGGMANDDSQRCQEWPQPHGKQIQREQHAPRRADTGGCGVARNGDMPGRMANGECQRRQGIEHERDENVWQSESASSGAAGRFWSDFNLVYCLDDKVRRVSAQPGDEPLSHGIPRDVGLLLAELAALGYDTKAARKIIRTARGNRIGRLRGYGNAIVPSVAAMFIRAFLEAEADDKKEEFSDG